MSASPTYLEVAVAAPLPQTLTYAVPTSGEIPVPGQRVLVPLGKRLLTGYVLALSEEKPEFRLKRVTEILDAFPVFPEALVPFFRWVARYYHYPIGEVIRGALPGGLTSQSGRQLKVTEAGRHYFLVEQPQLALDYPWLANLLANKKLSAATVRKLWRGKERRLIEQWGEQGLISVEQIISGASIGQKTETCVSLTEEPLAPETLTNLKPSEAKTLALIKEMRTDSTQALPRRELTKAYSGAAKALASLAEKGIIRLEERPVYRDPFGETPLFYPRPAQLTADQENALAQLNPAIAKKQYAAFLLHGVTGSGKTEVYLQAAETTLALGRSVLVLVPEIALATQLEAHFLSRFGETVALLHSGLARGERFDQWQRVVSGEARIVIGARSAIFAPLADPGLIIVDEEHDGAYKQEDSLRYQGRDLALLRGSQGGATVLLGSATPSLASYQHALNGKYTLLSLPSRIENRPLPQVELVDLQAVNTVSGRPPLFSPQLKQALRATLARQEQSLVFLNRRGFAGCMLCSDCGQAVQCPHCRITLTLHKGRGELVCHYCGFATNSRTVCTNCRSLNLAPIGFGTERIEEELAGMSGLGMPDYKAGERTFQLLAQVTGRAGRGEQPGRVIVQTHQPGHYSIAAARDHDYPRFFEKETGLRKALGYPPFSRLINLVVDGEQEEAVQSRAEALSAKGKTLRRYQKTAILGPAPAPLARLRGRFRWQILLKGPDIEELHGLCLELEQEHARLAGAVNLSVDVDPESML
ncbi:MAG: primosomal protein N' [Deltaproteobacteria bacterium]|nr:primosomal protein N' [Deltaproteobacteria bacterium]